MKNLFIQIRRLIYGGIYLLDTSILKRKAPVVILCYHSISDDGWDFSVSLEMFKKQIKYLKKQFEFVTVNDVVDYVKGKKNITKPSVVITFDDGYKNVLLVKDFLKEQSISPALFAIADPANANRKELETDLPFLTPAEIKKLKEAGWTVGCHSLTHTNFRKMNSKETLNQVKNAKQVLEKDLDQKVVYFAYPKGAYTPLVLKTVKESGYKAAFSMNDELLKFGQNCLTIPRVGVDNSHSFLEFKGLLLPSAILFRKYIKQTYLFFKSLR